MWEIFKNCGLKNNLLNKEEHLYLTPSLGCCLSHLDNPWSHVKIKEMDLRKQLQGLSG